jgi:ferredoxin
LKVDTDLRSIAPIGDTSFKALKIYYFSGTGNAAHVAKWFSEEAVIAGVESELINIARLKREDLGMEKRDTLLGFCSPTHGFNFPPITIKLLFNFPRGKNRVFIMNTRAGMKLWKIHTIGLSGIAQLLAAIVLLLKGYKVVGMRPVDLPSNWISIHPGIRKKVVSSIFMRCEKNTRRFARNILTGKKRYRALFDIVQDLAVSPIALAYYFVGRFILAKSFVASHACTMCGLCIKSCPVGAVKELDKRPYWTLKCESCMKCMNACPERAIQTAHGFVIGTLYIILTAGMEWLYYLTVDRLPAGTLHIVLDNGNIRFLIASALCIPFLFMNYRIVHYLMHFRLFERMVVFTSLTVFKFWRRYKGVVNKVT